jgi:hypothetical protein
VETRGYELINIRIPFDFQINPFAMAHSNYAFMNADVVIRFQLSGTKFHQGRLIAYWNPILKIPNTTLTRNTVMPHILIDATKSINQELTIPFSHIFSMINSLDVDAYNTIGTLTLKVMNPLTTGASGAQAINLTMYGHYSMPHLRNPTHLHVPNFAQGDDLFGDIGKIAEMVLPLLGNLDHPCDSNVPMRDHTFSDVTHGDGGIRSVRLAGTQTETENIQKHTLDTLTDEMNLNVILKIPNYYKTLTWDSTKVSGETLIVMRNAPAHFATTEKVGTVDYIYPTTLAYTSLAYQLWRGDIIYRFDVIATDFHKGRLLVTYTPFATQLSFEQALNQTQWTLDIQELHQFEIKVPYMSTSPYLYCDDETNMSHITGMVQVFVLNELAYPGDVSPHVEINIYVSAGDGFEYKYPKWKQSINVAQGMEEGTTESREAAMNSQGAAAIEKDTLVSGGLAGNHMNLQSMCRRPAFRSFPEMKKSESAPAIFLKIQTTPTHTTEVRGYVTHMSHMYRFMRGPMRYAFAFNTNRTENGVITFSQNYDFGPESITTEAINPEHLLGGFTDIINLANQQAAEITTSWISPYVKTLIGPASPQTWRSNGTNLIVGGLLAKDTRVLIMHSLADETRLSYFLGPPSYVLI